MIHSTKQNGFTLIELLVVVGIVGVLASLAISEFSEYKKKARDVVAISFTKNALTAMETQDSFSGTVFNDLLPDNEDILYYPIRNSHSGSTSHCNCIVVAHKEGNSLIVGSFKGVQKITGSSHGNFLAMPTAQLSFAAGSICTAFSGC